jgi:serine phosphatase RsbU (regulator of sigma subunit)/putative methionine-R-sulfoxide reductase with GAF domain
MSILPLPLSSNEAFHPLMDEILNLAEILATHYSLESLLSFIKELLERNNLIVNGIWLSPSLLPLIRDGVKNDASLLGTLSPLLEQAYREKRILPNTSLDIYAIDKGSTLAIPLLVRDEVLGVIQVDKKDQVGFSVPDIEIVPSIISQFTLALGYLQYKSHSEYLLQNLTHLTTIEEISKSFLSNLDRDSLLNSILTLVRQRFDFRFVNLYTLLGDKKGAIKQIGISEDGIEPEKFFDYEKDAGPVHWSIAHLEPVIINNMSLDSRFPEIDLRKNIHSEMVIPLCFGELFIGAIELCSDTSDAFGPDTIKGYHLLAQSIAVALRNANLYRSEQISRLINDRLQKKIGTISAEVTLDDSLHALLDELEEILPWDAAAIWLIGDTTNDSEVSQFASLPRLAAARVKEQPSPETELSQSSITNELFSKYIQNSTDASDLWSAYPWNSEILNSETPAIRSTNSAYEPLGALLGLNLEYSAIGAPIISNNQPRGIIVLVHHLSNQYDVDTQTMAKAFTNTASIVIENVMLYEAAHEQAWISTVLLQVAEATQSITNIDELLQTVVSMLPGLIGVNACTIFLWDQSIETFYPQASYGFDAEQLARFNEWEIYPGSVLAFDHLKDSNNPVILNAETLSDITAAQVFPAYDFRNDLLILFPLYTQNKLCGAFLIDFTNSTLEIDSSQDVWDEKYSLIQGAARQTAIAVENIQLIKSQEEEAYISVALLQVAQAIVSLNRLDEILESIVRITPILVGVKRCIIYLWDSKDLVFRQSEYYGLSKNDLIKMGQAFKADEFPFVKAIQQTNQILYHSCCPGNAPLTWNEFTSGDYQVIRGKNPDSDQETSIKLDPKTLTNRERLLIGFPLSVKGEILGVMLIEEEEPVKGSTSIHIREKRIEIVKGITQQAAVAIKNELLQQDAVKSERMERELQLAREIQTTFLPDRLPEIPGWDIGVRWQPARQVGGDFYDILSIDNNRIGFVIADVADKGMPAALFMTLIRTLIRAAAKEKKSPAAVLKQVNELLVPDSKRGMFVTVFYGVFSLDSGKIVYANAGHNPPIVKRLNRDEFIELTRTTMALGIFADIDVDERELTLNPGDWMLLYTDGVTEAFSAKDEMFGTERLTKLLQEHQFVSSDGLINEVERAVEDFIHGTDLSDDLTLAAIMRKIT